MNLSYSHYTDSLMKVNDDASRPLRLLFEFLYLNSPSVGSPHMNPLQQILFVDMALFFSNAKFDSVSYGCFHSCADWPSLIYDINWPQNLPITTRLAALKRLCTMGWSRTRQNKATAILCPRESISCKLVTGRKIYLQINFDFVTWWFLIHRACISSSKII